VVGLEDKKEARRKKMVGRREGRREKKKEKRPRVCLRAEHNETKERMRERRSGREREQTRDDRDEEAKMMVFSNVPRRRGKERDGWWHV